MPSKSLLLLARKTHLYFGLFIAPALLFFAFTGAMQTLSLHEAAGTAYKPPAVLAIWGQIHKKQTWVLPARRPPASDNHRDSPASATGTPARIGSGAGSAAEGPKFSAAPAGSPGGQPPVTLAGKQRQHLPLKLFFVLVSIGLFTSTLTGVYMAYKYDRNKILVTGILVAGAVLPIMLLRF